MSVDLLNFFRATDPSRTLLIKNGGIDTKYYIDFSSVRGGDIIGKLKQKITFFKPNQPTCTLFTGHIGCGKSTELLRLQGELEKESFLVIYFESSEDLEMTLCYYEKAKLLEKVSAAAPTQVGLKNKGEIQQQVRDYLQQALEAFATDQCLDLIADSIAKFGSILQDLQDWPQLQTLAEQALSVYKLAANPSKIAQDYGFLAAVALTKDSWQQAQELAHKGLEVLASSPQSMPIDLKHRQKLLLILASAQGHLEQYQSAIQHLQTAKKIGVLDNNPQLYLQVLDHCLEHPLPTRKSAPTSPYGIIRL